MSALLAGEWDSYRCEVIPDGAPEVQVTESRRAFYAGAYALLSLLLNNLSEGDEAEEVDFQMLGELHAELTTFAEDVKRWRA